MRRPAVPLLAALTLLALTSATGATTAATAMAATTSSAAGASCIAAPPRSATAFTGTVASTSADGRDVQVVGSPAPEPDTATSVDRPYAAGARYEFHPRNPANPYADDLCTATHEIAAPPEPPATTVWTGAFVTALVALGVVALVGSAAAFLVPSRRRRNRRRRRRT